MSITTTKHRRDPETGRYEHDSYWVPEDYGVLDLDGQPWAGELCYACGKPWEHGSGAPPDPKSIKVFLQGVAQ